MIQPEALYVSWQHGQIRVRHDDERLGPYSPAGAVIRNAVELATDLRGLELVLNATVGDRYRIAVHRRPRGVRGVPEAQTRGSLTVTDPATYAQTYCPSCGLAIYVRSVPDGRRHLLSEAGIPAFERRWDAEFEGRAKVEAAEMSLRTAAMIRANLASYADAGVCRVHWSS